MAFPWRKYKAPVAVVLPVRLPVVLGQAPIAKQVTTVDNKRTMQSG